MGYGSARYVVLSGNGNVEGIWKSESQLLLTGAPYGYTPFCSSRETTIGYQFWREGFWKTHLRGKPYVSLIEGGAHCSG